MLLKSLYNTLSGDYWIWECSHIIFHLSDVCSVHLSNKATCWVRKKRNDVLPTEGEERIDKERDGKGEMKRDRQTRGKIKRDTWVRVKIKLEKRTPSNMVCLNSLWWRSLSDSVCGLKDNRPTESFWQNMTLTLILPLRLSVCGHVTQSERQTGTTVCSHSTQVWSVFLI